MLKRKIWSVLLAGALLPVSAWAAVNIQPEIKVQYGKDPILFPDQKPVIQHDRTLVPIRPIAEILGFEVQWDDQADSVRLQKSQHVVDLVIGQAMAKRNEVSVELEVPAQLINDRTMVPLRFIAEALGYEVIGKIKINWFKLQKDCRPI